MDWLRYIQSIAPADVQHYITDATPVYFTSLGDVLTDFIRSLNNLLLTADRRTLANYMIYQYAVNRLALHKRFESPISNRETACIEPVKGFMRQATSAIFVRAHFSEVIFFLVREIVQEDRRSLAALFGDIRATLRENLEKCAWLDSETREAAVLKLDMLETKIGYPDMAVDDVALDRYYEDVRARKKILELPASHRLRAEDCADAELLLHVEDAGEVHLLVLKLRYLW